MAHKNVLGRYTDCFLSEFMSHVMRIFVTAVAQRKDPSLPQGLEPQNLPFDVGFSVN